jgi:hypothetical protein
LSLVGMFLFLLLLQSGFLARNTQKSEHFHLPPYYGGSWKGSDYCVLVE